MAILLFLHVLGAVLLVGNIVTAAFWKVRADLSGDMPHIHRTVKNVMLADYAFTLPGILLLVVTGSLMAAKGGYPMAGFNWLTLSLLLFAITGVIWLALLVPIQRGMIRHSGEAAAQGAQGAQGALPAAYKRLSLYWSIFGIAATLLPIVILYLMIGKPY